jgi:hypothetical protein
LGKGSNTTTTNTTSSADPQAAAAYRDILARAGGVASTPYQAYSGDLTAPINAQQQTGVAGINSNAGFATPYIQQASQQAAGASAPITSQTIQGYQNPYTQQVVDATTQQMAHDNATQQASLTGNQIAQGALGGNATGVARGVLAGQQGRTMASTVAGLYDKSYQQALQAAQQQQQVGLAGANAQANYGISGQNAALTGASAQIGAGSLEQQTEQKRLDALYGQYAQAQAYPYQQTQWLGGIATGVGSNLGGTSNGQTTGPAPNQTAQWLGAGLTAASMLSDRNAKEGIERIGKMNDGTPIYRFRYKGSPQWHVGPMAQDVERRNPDAVSRGVDGYRYVDMHEASEDSVERASGGGVVAPWAEAGKGWIPTIGISSGSGAPHASAPSAPSQGSFDPSKLASGLGAAGKGLGGLDFGGLMNGGLGAGSEAWGGGSFLGGDAFGGSSASPLPGLDASDYGEGFARGGGVAGYAGGGAPGIDFTDPARDMEEPPDDFHGRFAPAEGRPFGLMPKPQPSEDFRGRFSPAEAKPFGLMPKPQPPAPEEAPIYDDGQGPVRLYGQRPVGNPQVLRGAPVVDEDDDEAPAPSGVAGRTGGAGTAPVMAFGPSGAPNAYGAMPDATRRPSDERGGLGLLPISPNVSHGLLTAGLGMLASRSPFLGNAIGEGGLAGVAAYGKANEHDEKIATEAEKLSREQRQQNTENLMGERKQTEAERHNRVTETAEPKLPALYRRGADGSIELAPGAAEATAQLSAARKGPKADLMDDETAQLLADRVRAGDTRALIGLGRGAQGAENISKIQGIVARDAASGKPVSDAARSILSNAANHAGLLTAERTQAAIMAKLSVYGRAAFNATNIVESLSDKFGRTDFPPINKAIIAYKTKTGDPNVVALGQALTTLSNEYARAIGGGHGTVHDKEVAEQRLSAAQSKDQLRAVVGVMRQEIELAEAALPSARQQIRDIYNPLAGGPRTGGVSGHSPSLGVPTPPPAAGTIPSPAEREINKVYPTPKGDLKWTAEGWVKP